MLALSLLLTGFSFERLQELRPAPSAAARQEREVLYLPSGKGLRLLSFGYRNVLADVLWFNTISYFGKHYRSDQQYRWLNHMCDLVTTLDPKARHVYQFCALMLAWEAGLPRESIALMNRAIAANPDDWRYYYLRGMSYAFFLGESKRAREDFAEGASKPGAIPLLARLAAKQLALDDPHTALRFLENMIEQARDENQRAALTAHYKKALHEVNLQSIDAALVEYNALKNGYPATLQELAQALGRALPLHDPFGGEYFIDGDTQRAASTSKIQRIKLFKEERAR